MREYYPPVGFHFRVEFGDIPGLKTNDAYFQEVSGISKELQVQQVKAGGANNFRTELPSRTVYPNLILKRGLLVDSGIISWISSAIEDLDIQPVTVVVSLLNEERQPLQTYKFFKAWPKKWAISSFNAERNTIVVETIELVYQNFKIM